MILETTNYYPLPGKEAEVLAQRRTATAIRVALGLEPGEIFVRLDGQGPSVKWQCRFADAAQFEADMAARASSGEFIAARKQMHALIERFERHVHESAD